MEKIFLKATRLMEIIEQYNRLAGAFEEVYESSRKDCTSENLIKCAEKLSYLIPLSNSLKIEGDQIKEELDRFVNGIKGE